MGDLSAVRDVCVVVKTGLWPLYIFKNLSMNSVTIL